MDLKDHQYWRVVDGVKESLQRWVAGFQRQRPRKNSLRSRRCAGEALESRVLLTSPVASAIASPVTISGTSNDDLFTVVYSGRTAAAVATVTLSSARSAPRLVGIYPVTSRLAFFGLEGVDTVKITGTSGKDRFVVRGKSVKTNAREVMTNSLERIEMVGGDNDDIYAIDADTPLPWLFLDEAGGGVDTLDFSTTTTQGVRIDLGYPTIQFVNKNLLMWLKDPAGFENVLGSSLRDFVSGNSNANVLVGGPGDDFLLGMSGNDIVVGGTGNDCVSGGFDDDIVISGSTIFDANINALNELIGEWKSTAAYSTRVARLRGGVGVSRVSLVAKLTVLNDTSPAERIDDLTGQDWYFRSHEEFFFGGEPGEISDFL